MKSTILAFVLGSCFLVQFHPRLRAQDPAQQAEKHLIDSLDGRLLYLNYCATCHGNDGQGKGPMAGALKNPPSDLTQIAARNRGLFDSKKLTQIISGESELLSHGSREMPAWGPIFSQIAWDQDLGRVRIANVVRYLETIQGRSGVATPRR